MDHTDVEHPQALEKVIMTDEQGQMRKISELSDEGLAVGLTFLAAELWAKGNVECARSIREAVRRLRVAKDRLQQYDKRHGDRTDSRTNSTAA